MGPNGAWWIFIGAAVFRGEHPLTLDDRGRVAVPSKYRERLREDAGGFLVVTVSIMETCLVVYPFPEWQRIESELEKQPALDPQVHVLNHVLVGRATECEMDGHGRILLPPSLREFAGLDPKDPEGRSIRMIGQVRKFELWREDRWKERLRGLLENIGDLTSNPQSVVSTLVL